MCCYTFIGVHSFSDVASATPALSFLVISVTDLIPVQAVRVQAVRVQDCQLRPEPSTDAVSLNLYLLRRSKHSMSVSVQTNGAWYAQQLSLLNSEKGLFLEAPP